MTGERGRTVPAGPRVLRRLDAMAELAQRPLRSAAGTSRRILAFALIVLATLVTKLGRPQAIMRQAVLAEVRRAGLGLLPFIGLLSFVTGVVAIGQTLALLRQIGAEQMLGKVMVMAVFRELAPLATGLLVLLRVGTPMVIELATMRATGDVEALEALSIDPIHFLAVPKVVGLAVSVFCLTVYFLLGSLAGGYLFCYVQQLPLALGDYLGQLAAALTGADFVLLVLKTFSFGGAIAVITCYHGLASPLRLEQVPMAATRAVTHSVAFCLLLDVALLGLYFLP